jgi:hypothetical protein
MIITAALMTVLATGASHVVGSVRHFQRTDKSIVPKSLLDSQYLCGGVGDTTESVKECEEDFKRIGAVWTGDVNDDGTQELVIYPGTAWSGSGGDSYFLFRKRGRKWIPLFPSSQDWFTRDPRFDILPLAHEGYHDLRIAQDWCVKWDGKRYVNYSDADYHRLPLDFFDPSQWTEAGIFWTIHYRGLKTFRLAPKYGLAWIAVFKGGVWGVRDTRAFLLFPQLAYTGAHKLEFQGDWLLIYGEEPWAVAKYNRRTKELDVLTSIL